MQGQIEGVNGFVVNIFSHYILSDKDDLELERGYLRLHPEEAGLPAKTSLSLCWSFKRLRRQAGSYRGYGFSKQ